MGINKTKCLLRQCYWPGIKKGVTILFHSSEQCHFMKSGKKIPKVSIKTMDIPSRPFQKIGIDTAGPLKVMSNKGNQYNVTVLDLCTT